MVKRHSGKLVGRCSGSNGKTGGKATLTKNQSLELVGPEPFYLIHSRRYWSSSPNVGECEIKVEVDHWEDPEEDAGPMVILEMRWTGAFDCPDEWTLRWVHYLDYLGYMLPQYLREYSPAPKEMLYQLVSNLEPIYASYFGDWKANLGQVQP